MNIDTRHPQNSESPNTATNNVHKSGITICVTPPPMLPHPAVVALAVPTQFGANINEVWYCVMTNEAPITPISSRKIKNVSNDCANPIVMTGIEPRIKSHL